MKVPDYFCVSIALLMLSGCAQIKKAKEELSMPEHEIMSKQETEDYIRNKLVENNFNFRNCLSYDTKRVKPVINIHFKIEHGVLTKSEAGGARLPSHELKCLSKEAGKMEFMMIKNYEGHQTVRL